MTYQLTNLLPTLPMLRILLALPMLLAIGLSPGRARAQDELHVALNGYDTSAGTAERPLRTVQRAVDLASPGREILIHAGTYDERVEITRSGTQDRPVVLRSAGDGPAILRASLAPRSCASLDPARDRTLSITGGSDHWVIRDLTIVGGIFVSGTNVGDPLKPHLRNRGIPGRGARDAEGARSTLGRLGSDGADGMRIVGNDLRGRGIYGIAARYGVVEDNEIHDVACGTGGGVWLGRFSDGWIIRDNRIHDLAASTEHFMSEGVRLSGGSNYNTIEDNLVEDVASPGRGIATDVNSSWNLIRRNRVARAEIGFSEQLGGWGNEWSENVSEDNSRAGFGIYTKGESDPGPSDSAPSQLVVRCNASRREGVSLTIGAVQRTSFQDNEFSSVSLSAPLHGYWTSAGNTWEGLAGPPPENPPASPAGCAPPTASERIWGDVNGDGEVGRTDALIVLNHVTGIGNPDADISLADVDDNGRVTSSDAFLILDYAVGVSRRGSRAGRPVR